MLESKRVFYEEEIKHLEHSIREYKTRVSDLEARTATNFSSEDANMGPLKLFSVR